MSKLSTVTSNPMIRQYAQGVAHSSIQPIADFLAPTVNVPTMSGRFKVYGDQNRFKIPDTARALGGPATQVRFTADDGTYQCQPRALDYPIDNLEKLESADLEDAVKEGMLCVSELASLDHEKRVVDMALGALSSRSANKTWTSSADPVADLDTQIRDIMLNVNYGSMMDIGVIFGCDAWLIFKNHAKVRSMLPVGRKSDNLQIVDMPAARSLLLGTPETRVSFMAYDSAPEGKQASPAFILGTKVLIFARHKTPTRRDPSFMKTFRLNNRYMVPGSYETVDGRGEVVKFDWSEDPHVINASAGFLLNVSAS